MAANTIKQITTANTFQHWLTASQLLIATSNLLTNGNGESFYANTRLIVGGEGANVSLNVETGATINTLEANVVNTINGTVRNLVVTQNVETLNVTTDLFVGDDLTVYGDTTIVGDLTVSGNLTLDALGFDDLSVSGSGTFGNTLAVTGTTTLTNVTVLGNIATLNVTTTTALGGDVAVTGNTFISGDLTVRGNIILDAVGFDDLTVSGSASIANNITVAGTANTTGNATFRHATVTGTLTANVLTGNANTAIFNAISSAESTSLAFAIALG
jgi:hypothetical protein